MAKEVDALGLPHHAVWEALLHLDRQQPQIKDRSFLLSGSAFSPRSEMLATLEHLWGLQAGAVCRFPARYLWLQKQLKLPELPLDQCPDWVELSTRAPLETLSLVFVSESVSLPASMMGHSFLKLAGRNPAGEAVEHVISFYTPAESYNLPKLYWEAMVSGKDGVFALAPFDEVARKYLELEKRNLWVFELQTRPEDRQLIQAHLLELKQTKLLYWFHSYNCATLLRNLIALTGRLPASTQWWETPKDLGKAVQEAGLVSRTEVQLTSEWLVDHMHGEAALDQPWLQGIVAKARLDTLLAQKKLSPEQWASSVSALAATDGAVPLEPALNPSASPPDSQVQWGFYRLHGEDRVRLVLLPLSHQFLDIQAHTQAETQLEFMSAALSWGPSSGLRVDHLNVYAMRSLNPWNPTTRRFSNEFKLGYDQLAPHSSLRRGLQVHTGWGGTYRVHRSADVYALGGLGWGRGLASYRVRAAQEWGAVARLGPGTKANIAIRITDALGRAEPRLVQRKLALTRALSTEYSFHVQLTRTRTAGRTENGLEASLKHLF